MAVFLDTHIFLYAAGTPHSLREPCVRILGEVAAGRLAAATSTEVIQELLYVLARRQRGTDGVRLARGAMALVPQVLPIRPVEMARACDLLGRHATLPVRDAVHAATMLNHGLTTIVSADQHFDLTRSEGITRVDPATAPW